MVYFILLILQNTRNYEKRKSNIDYGIFEGKIDLSSFYLLDVHLIYLTLKYLHQIEGISKQINIFKKNIYVLYILFASRCLWDC